jgi:malate dehydrogenase (oxaloacetate-decarboxylating)
MRTIRLRDNRILIYGAGAAGLGIARQLRSGLIAEGLDGIELQRAILVMDSGGIVSERRERLDDYKRELAWPAAAVDELALEGDDAASLLRVVASYRPTVLIGASGQGGAFDKAVVQKMAEINAMPVILPLSNPTSISEAVPEDLFRWTDNRALIATGSPFDYVQVRGGPRRVGQANNVFIFPGLGLGTIVSGASRVTDNMISAAAVALANSLDDDERAERCLVPKVARLWDVCGHVALAVAGQAVREGVAAACDETAMRERIETFRWRPAYPSFVAASDRVVIEE